MAERDVERILAEAVERYGEALQRLADHDAGAEHADPRSALRDLSGEYTHLHDRCHAREAELTRLLRECSGLVADRTGGTSMNVLLRRVEAALNNEPSQEENRS